MTEVQAPVRKRWSARFVKNLMAILLMTTIISVSYVQQTFALGFDMQASRCLPWVVYWIKKESPEAVKRGELYQYRFDSDELLAGNSLVKYAAAIPGDRVRLDGTGVWINEGYWGPMHPVQVERLLGMDKSPFATFVVPKGKVLMLGTLPQTYDGRYAGLVDLNAINGTATPLW